MAVNDYNEVYQKRLPIWEKAALAFTGGPDFRSKYLSRFIGEDTDDYVERLNLASYENHMTEIMERRAAVVLTKTVQRTVSDGRHLEDTSYKEVLKNADGMGMKFDDFRTESFRLANQFGFCPVFVDGGGKFPTLHNLDPRTIINWSVDKDNQLEWVVIKSVFISQPTPEEDAEEIIQYRVINKMSVDIYEERQNGRTTDIVLIKRIPHELGRVPIVTLYDLPLDGDKFVGRSSIEDSIDLSVSYFNQNNWYDFNVMMSNYSVLAVTPKQGGTDQQENEVVIGPAKVLEIAPNSAPPQWISPSTKVADVFDRKLKVMLRRIYEMAQIDAAAPEETRAQLSGLAYRYRRLPTEDSARRFGENLQNWELDLWAMIMLRAGDSSTTVEVAYPEQYSTELSAAALIQLEKIEGLKTLPQNVKQTYAKHLPYTDSFAGLTEKEQKEMSEEIANYDPGAEKLEITQQETDIRTESKKQVIEAEKQAQIEVQGATAETPKPEQQRGNLFGV